MEVRNDLCLLHINIQSLRNKINLLDLFLNQHNVSFLNVCEHWLSSANFELCNIGDYVGVSYFARTNAIHGGSAIYVKKSIYNECVNLQYITSLCEETHFECAAIVYRADTCIINIYRAPAGNVDIFFDKISFVLRSISSKYKYFIITGDFNIDKSNNANFKMLTDILNSYNLLSLVNTPTRVASTVNSISCTSLDYLIVSKTLTGYTFDNLDPGFSDHFLQMINFNINIPKTTLKPQVKQINVRSINQETINEFETRFNANYSILDTVDCTNIDDVYDDFMKSVLWCLDVSCPIKKKSIVPNNKKIKFSYDLYKRLDDLKGLNWLRKNSSCVLFHDQYKQLKKETDKLIKIEKQQHINNILENSINKSKTVWLLINNNLGNVKNYQTVSELRIDNKKITNSQDIVNSLGTYFSGVISNKLNSHFNNRLSVECTTSAYQNTSLFLTPVLSHDVNKIISSLKNKKSCGIDNVPVDLIKKCSSCLVEPLVYITNKAIELGKFPDSLKISSIIPVYKKGSRHDMENYRPISLLSIFSKIIEKIITEKISSFLELNNIFSTSQHGFRKEKSTETACIEYIQFINDCMDRNECTVTIFFDLTRAFDTLNISFVSKKLDALGIRGRTNDFIISFLTNRKSLIKIGDCCSDVFDVRQGTPQGSVLGPLIFLLYVNDLPEHITDGSVFMYADDTSIVISDKNPDNVIIKASNVLNMFDMWCTQNSLIINYDKTVCIETHNVHRADKNITFKIGGVELKCKDSIKFLGILVDRHLLFNDHIEHVCCKISKAFYAISQLKNSFNEKSILTTYYAMVYSHISYNIIVWGQSPDISRLFVLQKRILRLIFNLPYNSSCRLIFKDKKILTISSIYLFKILLYIYKNKHLFPLHSNIHTHDTRRKDTFYLNKPNHTFYQKSPIYAGCNFFNMLPSHIKQQTSPSKFRNQLKNFLIQHSFYSLDEFVHACD